MSREEILWWSQWVTQLCLVVGSDISTAYKCGAAFAQGLGRMDQLHSGTPPGREKALVGDMPHVNEHLRMQEVSWLKSMQLAWRVFLK